MDLSPGQYTTLRNAILAETDPSVVAALAVGDHVTIMNFYNAATATLAWRDDVTAQELDEGANITAFDGLTAGKRDAWRLFLEYAPRDFRKNVNRKAIEDIWGTSSSNAQAGGIYSNAAYGIFVQAATRPATRAELLLNNTTTWDVGVNSGLVSARRLPAARGKLSTTDIYNALK